MFEELTVWQAIQLAGPAVMIVGAWFTMRAKVSEMQNAIQDRKSETTVIAAALAEHVKESNAALRDIAELNVKMDFMLAALRRLEDWNGRPSAGS